jgi:hypothetical protein
MSTYGYPSKIQFTIKETGERIFIWMYDVDEKTLNDVREAMISLGDAIDTLITYKVTRVRLYNKARNLKAEINIQV